MKRLKITQIIPLDVHQETQMREYPLAPVTEEIPTFLVGFSVGDDDNFRNSINCTLTLEFKEPETLSIADIREVILDEAILILQEFKDKSVNIDNR